MGVSLFQTLYAESLLLKFVRLMQSFLQFLWAEKRTAPNNLLYVQMFGFQIAHSKIDIFQLLTSALYQFTLVLFCLWRNGFQQFELLIYIFQARWSPNGPWGDPLNTYLVQCRFHPKILFLPLIIDACSRRRL